MNAETQSNIAIKITKTIFCFRMVGFGMNAIYHTTNRSLILADAETGAPFKVVEKDKDLTFKEFDSISKSIWMELVEMV